MAAPITTAQQWTQPAQYFKLVPGTQFSDDFSHLKPPFTGRNPWQPVFLNSGDASRFAFSIAGEAFQIETVALPLNGQVAILQPEGGSVMRDIYATVDILDWASTSESALGIAGRVQGGLGHVDNAYLGSVRMNPATGTGQLWFFNGESDVQGSAAFPIATDSDYRLQLLIVGSQLTLQLFDVADPPTPVAQGFLQDSRFSRGRVALWVNTRGGSGYRRTVDNFFVTGTKPEPP